MIRRMPCGKDEFDAVLMIAFGGPERPEDIRPFLQNVVRGRRVPAERLDEVAHHYELMGGKSPLNELTFKQAKALERTLAHRPIAPSPHLPVSLPVYVGMRNWHPRLVDTVRQMARDDVKRAVGLIMAPQQSDSSWEKYQRNVTEAIAEAGAGLEVKYTRTFFDHPQFIKALVGRVLAELHGLTSDVQLVFTAHSVPLADPFHQRYAEQIAGSVRLAVALLIPRLCRKASFGSSLIAYQSRSGRPQDPWLEPDVNDALRDLRARGAKEVVVVPIGFVCDHVEVLYDLDIEAAATARELGLTMRRAKTVEDDPLFIECLADVVRIALS